jgi:hypothetical protein
MSALVSTFDLCRSLKLLFVIDDDDVDSVREVEIYIIV